MPMSNVERYKAGKIPYYVRMSSRGQVTLPKPLRNACGFDAKNQLVKITALETGMFLESVVAITAKGQNNADPEGYEKDPELVEAERADETEFYRNIARR